jgi:DNA-binding FadR family transcriptional regulator
MQGLRAMGIVEIRPRLGARVLGSSGGNVLATSAISRLLRDGTIDELYDARLVLEPGVAARAATHRTEEDLIAIKTALMRFRVAFELGTDCSDADIEFHRAIANASGNTLLAKVLAPMGEVLREARRATATIPEAVEKAMHEHEAIAQAIEERSSARAQRAMMGHIRSGIWAIGELKRRDRAAQA